MTKKVGHPKPKARDRKPFDFGGKDRAEMDALIAKHRRPRKQGIDPEAKAIDDAQRRYVAAQGCTEGQTRLAREILRRNPIVAARIATKVARAARCGVLALWVGVASSGCTATPSRAIHADRSSDWREVSADEGEPVTGRVDWSAGGEVTEVRP
jgi:hypothetical protein